MLGQLLPARLDNSYQGSRIAPWLLGLVLTVKLLQSVMSTFFGAYVASSADGIPLDTYAPAAAQTFIAMFALLGGARQVPQRRPAPARPVLVGLRGALAGPVLLADRADE